MNKAMVRMLFTGAFAIVALGIAGGCVLTDRPVEAWLAGVIGLASGYLFGHIQENGINGKKGH